MNPENTLNLKQISGSTQIKQGDTGSVLTYQLVDTAGQPVKGLDGVRASIVLSDLITGVVKFQAFNVISGSLVSFNAGEAPAGTMVLEIEAGGRIFPSDRSSRLKIIESVTKVSAIPDDTNKQTGSDSDIWNFNPSDNEDLLAIYNNALK